MYWAARQTGNHALKIQYSSLMVSLIPTGDKIPVLPRHSILSQDKWLFFKKKM